MDIQSRTKEDKKRTYRDTFLATTLYNILGGGRNLKHCVILATALGSKATSDEKKKDWIKSIAREFAHEVTDDIGVSGETNSTARTTPTTASTITSPSTMLTSTTAPSTLTELTYLMGATTVTSVAATAISLNGAQSKQLSSLITNVDCNQMMMISPLKPPTLTTTTTTTTTVIAISASESESKLASNLALASESEPALTVASTSHALTSKYDLVACEKNDSIITAIEMLAVSNKAGFKVPTIVTCSFVKNLLRLLKEKKLLISNKHVIGQLRKKMGRLETNGTVPSKIELVQCLTTQTYTKLVVFYFIKNVPLLMEILVAGYLLDGKYEDSSKISNFKDKIIFKIGADCGGSDLINEIGLVNRDKGNSGQYSIPIGVVEGATEVHSNMVKTIYSPVRKRILEQLLNQHLWMVRIFFYQTDDSTLQEARCCLLHLKGIERKKLSKTKFVCTIDGCVSRAATEWKSKGDDRSVVDTASVNENMFSGYVFYLTSIIVLSFSSLSSLFIMLSLLFFISSFYCRCCCCYYRHLFLFLPLRYHYRYC